MLLQNRSVSGDENSSFVNDQEFLQITHHVLMCISIVVAVISCILNSVAVLVFFRRPSNTAAVTSLLILTGVEVWYTVARFLADSFWLLRFFNIFSVLRHVVNASLLSRNWWTTFLAASRCTAILVPLSRSGGPSNNHLQLSNRGQVALCIGLVTVAMTVSVLVPGGVIILQVGLPVPIVMLCCLLTTMFLLMGGRHGNSHVHCPSNPRYRATRTILALSFSFSLLESLTLVTDLLTRSGSLTRTGSYLLNPICNLLTIIDSAANLVILLTCSHRFRKDFSQLCCHQGNQRLQSTALSRSATLTSPTATHLSNVASLRINTNRLHGNSYYAGQHHDHSNTTPSSIHSRFQYCPDLYACHVPSDKLSETSCFDS